ncbi:hypothetical protein GOBAR_DD17274 [Gossypium barbadense]|nr:hypothetical protein GOBAR_DD17274 [Gossypium barbadense]
MIDPWANLIQGRVLLNASQQYKSNEDDRRDKAEAEGRKAGELRPGGASLESSPAGSAPRHRHSVAEVLVVSDTWASAGVRWRGSREGGASWGRGRACDAGGQTRLSGAHGHRAARLYRSIRTRNTLMRKGKFFLAKQPTHRFNIFPMIQLQNLLEAFAFYTQTISFRDMGLPKSTHLSGNLVLALVVVNKPGFMFLKRDVIIVFLAKDKGFGGSGVSGN